VGDLRDPQLFGRATGRRGRPGRATGCSASPRGSGRRTSATACRTRRR
jgi:hypothetical protein